MESTTQYRNYTLRLDIWEDSYNTTNNTSLVKYALYIVNGGARFNAGFNYTVTVNGTQLANFSGNVNTTDVGYYDAHWLQSGEITITHDADGSKSVWCSAECSGGGSYGPGYGAVSGSLTLTTIPRAAVITSFVGTDIDNDLSVGYTKYVNNWTYYLRVSISGGAQLERFVYNTSGTVFRLSDAAKETIYNSVGNNDTVTLSAVIETWNGGTKIGESSALTSTCNINRNMWLNVSGTWKRGIPYVNVNGVWKKGIPYININGVWKKAI